MVRDFRPCLKYGQAALYDDVSKTIFYPEGDPLGYDVNTGKNLYVFANNNGTAASFARSRLCWLKLRQNGVYVRKFQTVRLKNGLAGLFDHAGEKPYLPRKADGSIAYFSALGSETAQMRDKDLMLILR